MNTVIRMSKNIEALAASPWFMSALVGLVAGASVAQYQLNQHEARLDKMDIRYREAYDLLTRIDERVKALGIQIQGWEKSK